MNERFNAKPALDHYARALEATRNRRDIKQNMLDTLYRLGDSEHREIRNSACSARRAIGKDRVPNEKDLTALRQIASISDWRDIERWMTAHRAEEECMLASAQAYAACLAHGRRALADLSAVDSFSSGIHASNRRLYAQYERYAQAAERGEPLDKKLRQTEDSVISYLFRALSKPSPFGAFTSIYAAFAGATNSSAGTRHTRISRDILLWMEYQAAHKIDDIAQALPLRLNRTVKLEDGAVTAFVRGANGTQQMLGGEKFIKIKSNPLIAHAIALVSSGQLSISALQAALARGELAQPPEKIAQVSNALVAAGIFERDFGIPDNEQNFPLKARLVLEAIATPGALAMASVFRDVESVELQMSATRAGERSARLSLLSSAITRVAELSGTALQSIDAIPNIYFEDVGGGHAAPTASLSPADIGTLEKLIPLLMLFDEHAGQLGVLQELFASHTAEQGAALPLFDFYRRFRELGNEEIMRRMSPEATGAGRAAARCKAEFLQFISAAIEGTVPGSVVDLASPAFDAWLQKQPLPESGDSHSVFVQRDCAGGKGWVLNNAGTGNCASMSRFAVLFGEEDSSFIRSMKECLQGAHPARNLVDILAVFGANSNIHPLLTDSALLYPGSCARSSDAVVHPAEVEVYLDRDTGRLALRTTSDRKRLDLVSLNFLHPASGPLFYRFLHAFTPYWSFKSTDFADMFSKISYIPRIKLDCVIIMRETFNMNAGSIQQTIDPAASDFENFLAVNQWRTDAGLPAQAYFRVPQSHLEFAQSAVPSIEAMMTLRRGRLRKPHLIDFENPYLVRIFVKQILSLDPAKTVQFQEALPDYSSAALQDVSAREYIFQIDKRS